MPVQYLLSEFIGALVKNLAVYLEAGEEHESFIREQLSLTRDKGTAMSIYRSIVNDFKGSVYCEINEDYNRLERHEDLLKRWEAARDAPRKREALERLIITFDLNNYAPPIAKRFFA